MQADRRRSDCHSRAGTGCGFLATSSDLRERQISGTPTADPIEVVAYAEERETQAIADRKAADDAFLAALETEVKQSIKEHFESVRHSSVAHCWEPGRPTPTFTTRTAPKHAPPG